MVCRANMNLCVPQCKNCWKWGHMASVCYIQWTKCVKCNGPHLISHHCYFAWCCKANNKTNPPRLETKKGKSCSYLFKCLNCKGDHQVDSNECPFWRYCFNKEWHIKEYAKLWKLGGTQLVWLWTLAKYDFERSEGFFHKMSRKITLLSAQSSKSTVTLILSSFKNHLGQPLDLFPVQRTMKALPW